MLFGPLDFGILCMRRDLSPIPAKGGYIHHLSSFTMHWNSWRVLALVLVGRVNPQLKGWRREEGRKLWSKKGNKIKQPLFYSLEGEAARGCVSTSLPQTGECRNSWSWHHAAAETLRRLCASVQKCSHFITFQFQQRFSIRFKLLQSTEN